MMTATLAAVYEDEQRRVLENVSYSEIHAKMSTVNWWVQRFMEEQASICYNSWSSWLTDSVNEETTTIIWHLLDTDWLITLPEFQYVDKARASDKMKTDWKTIEKNFRNSQQCGWFVPLGGFQLECIQSCGIPSRSYFLACKTSSEDIGFMMKKIWKKLFGAAPPNIVDPRKRFHRSIVWPVFPER